MRIRERRLLDVVVDRAAALLVARLQLDLDPGAVRLLPLGLLVLQNQRLVLPGVDRDLEEVGQRLRRRPRHDGHRLAGGELAVHAGRRDADALLAALLLEAVELRTVEQLAEDLRDLRLHDARAVVLDRDPETLFRQLADLDAQLGEDARFLAGVERVVDALAHRGEERLLRVVEAEQVAVLDEELGDRDLALLLGEALRGGAARRDLADGLRSGLNLGGFVPLGLFGDHRRDNRRRGRLRWNHDRLRLTRVRVEKRGLPRLPANVLF